MAKKNNPDRGLYERPPGSGTWWIQYNDCEGNKKREKVGTKVAARQLYAKRQTEKLQKKKLPELTQQKVLTVAAMIEKFRPEFEARKSARDNRRYAAYWTEALGSVAANEVRPSDITAWRARRQKDDKVAPATVNRAVAFLKMVYNLAIKDDLVAANPVAKVAQIRENNERVRYLTEEEETALRPAAGDFWPKIEVALLSGLRQGEQFTLQRGDLDFRARVITIRQSKHGEKRTVPMSDRLAELLAAQLASHGSPWVYPGQDPGEHYRGRSAIGALQTALRRAGIQDFHWHDLRHSFCSRLAMAGVSLVTIAKLAGHKSTKVTERYAHLSPEHNKAAMELLAPRPKPAPEPPLPWGDPEALAEVLRERLTAAELAHLVAALGRRKRHLRAVE
ncbi:site-specific integrase [bacterium CPR1]|nr:site-specific integrase [bacterium CPR1]